jgi:hypothetical protein
VDCDEEEQGKSGSSSSRAGILSFSPAADEITSVEASRVIPVRGRLGAQYTDARCRTTLHWACVKGAPMEFLRELLEVCECDHLLSHIVLNNVLCW